MRVLVVTESFLPSVNGVTNSVMRVLDHLKSRGHDAIVVCPGPTVREYAGFPVVPVESFQYGGLRVGMVSSSLATIFDGFQPDVLHAAAPFGLGAQALAEANRRGVATVAIFQTDVAGFAAQHKFGATAQPIWRWMSYVHNRADVTLAPSKEALKDLASHGIHRTAQWGRGVDSALFHPKNKTRPGAQALRAKAQGDNPDAVVVGYVGRIAHEKEVERLAILSGHKSIRLLMVGDGPALPSCRRAMPDATFTGELSGEDLADAYAALDIFAHTGVHETFGQTLQEAMSSGIPVVAPAAGGPIDIVHEGVTGLLYTPRDSNALRVSVENLAQDPDRRARMGESARRQILPRSWEALGDELLGHYERAITGDPAPPPRLLSSLFRR